MPSLNPAVRNERTRATHEAMSRHLRAALKGLRILAGDEISPYREGWQDVAKTCEAHLRGLADQIALARAGKAEAFLAFPSPDDEE